MNRGGGVFDPIVRPAVADDIAELVALEREARRSVADQRGGPRWLATHPERGSDPAAWREVASTWTGLIDEVVIGYLVLRVEGAVATVDDVWVTPPARHVGFGDALLGAARDAARAQGCAVLEGEALPGDRETKNLYERAGITARLIVLSRQL